MVAEKRGLLKWWRRYAREEAAPGFGAKKI